MIDLVDPQGQLDKWGLIKTTYFGVQELWTRIVYVTTSKRVRWCGYHTITNPEIADRFTVANFILGNCWIRESITECIKQFLIEVH